MTAVFTSNREGRWEEFQTALTDPGADMDRATQTYFSGVSPLCTTQGLESLVANRTPSRLDQLANDQQCIFRPKEISLLPPEEGRADFRVLLSIVQEETELGTVELAGTLTFDEEETHLVNSLRVEDWSPLMDFFVRE